VTIVTSLQNQLSETEPLEDKKTPADRLESWCEDDWFTSGAHPKAERHKIAALLGLKNDSAPETQTTREKL